MRPAPIAALSLALLLAGCGEQPKLSNEIRLQQLDESLAAQKQGYEFTKNEIMQDAKLSAAEKKKRLEENDRNWASDQKVYASEKRRFLSEEPE